MLKNQIKYLFSTKLIYGQKARDQIISGVIQLNKATSSTLGPKGRNVCLDSELRLPRITKDGVTVAKNIMFKDKLKEIGASLIRSASGNTNKFAGDGTTTTIILANSILEEGQKYVNFNINPIELKRGMDIGKKHIIEYLEEIAIKAKSKEELFKVAMVCTNYDQKMSEMISEALWEVGLDGIIEIQPGNQLESHLEFSKGIHINRGFASRELISNKQSNKVELNYPLILITTQEIKQIREIVPALELAKKLNKSILICSKYISNEALSSLIFNQQKKIIECCAINVPSMGNYSHNLLEDLALLTGAKLFEEANFEQILNIKQEDFGRCQKVNVQELETVFQGTKGSEDKINERLEQFRHQLRITEKENSQKIIKERLARFTGKMAFIFCGGNTEVDMFENRDRLVDGLNGVKNAIKYGIVPGGGTCFIRAQQLLQYLELENFEQQCGLNALKNALLKPTLTLLDNAGYNGKYIVQKIIEKQESDPYIGYDLNTDEYVNLIQRGIFDSLTVSKSTIEDSISVASMILTTEVAVIKEKHYQAPSLKTYQKQLF